jgi:hypothetical protein
LTTTKGEARWTLEEPGQSPQLFTGEDGTVWQWNAATAEYVLYDPSSATAKQFTVSSMHSLKSTALLQYNRKAQLHTATQSANSCIRAA